MKEKKELYYGLKLAIPMLFIVVASVSPMFVRMVVDVSNSDPLSTTIKLIILGLGTLVLAPNVIGIPSQAGWKENLQAIGMGRPENLGKDIGVGILLGAISVGGMMLSSVVIGGYTFGFGNIEASHVYFSLVPGIFEEVVFRGFIMVVLLRQYRDMRYAVAFQVLLFTLSHMKAFDFWGVVDMLIVGVIAVAFTYVVYKTGSLLAAIIFHFIHDALLFAAQLPQEMYEGFLPNAIFYSFIIANMVVICLVVNGLYKDKKSDGIYEKALADPFGT